MYFGKKIPSLLFWYCSYLSAFICLEIVGRKTCTPLPVPGYSHTAADNMCSPILLKAGEVNQSVSWWHRKPGRKCPLFTVCSAWRIAISQERACIYIHSFGFVGLLSILCVLWLVTWSRHWLEIRSPPLLWIHL